jgi:hypothetical protein
MPDATDIGIRRNLKGNLFYGGKERLIAALRQPAVRDAFRKVAWIGGEMNLRANARAAALMAAALVETINLWALCESSSAPAYEPRLALRGASRLASDNTNDALLL